MKQHPRGWFGATASPSEFNNVTHPFGGNMPRIARIDRPGLLQHVIVRGIDKRMIFVDDDDRHFFLGRFSALLQETDTDCFAWALIPNHVLC